MTTPSITIVVPPKKRYNSSIRDKRMEKRTVKTGDRVVISRSKFQSLIESLRGAGYSVIGPTVCDGSIVLKELENCDDLPVGWTDRQEPASYRLEQREDEALFGHNVGPHSAKRFLFPPEHCFWRATKTDRGYNVAENGAAPPKLAFLGLRSCELSAVLLQDKVFTSNDYTDNQYQKQRENSLIVAVNCTQAGGNCFCASMGTGPKVEKDFDLALTEVLDGDQHYFLVEVGSEAGLAVMDGVAYRHAKPKEVKQAEQLVGEAAEQMGRSLETEGLKEILQHNPDNPHWDKVGKRCMSCGNCTMVCPTCFCTTIEDRTDLAGANADRVRLWDSCFTNGFSYIHGGSVRQSTKARYRQWMTHKLANWVDQFGTMGCVGCGRCITWCPVGIDITQEAAAIRASESDQVTIGQVKEKENAVT